MDILIRGDSKGQLQDEASSFFELYSESRIPVSKITPTQKISLGNRELYLYRLEKDTILDLGVLEFINAPEHLREIYSMEINNKNDHLKRTEIMAIVNSTPDSFYEGSRFLHNMKGLTEILDQKPDIIDIGGESTRPGSTEVHYEEEIKRLKPLIEYISGSCDIPISLDTRHPEVLEKFVSEVDIINDISGFRSDRMISIAAENDLECVLMHMKGTPENMNQFTSYSNIFLEISEFFMERINQMLEKGVRKGNIILDPGIGFSKTYQQNLQLLKNIRRFDFGLRTLVGASRKSFIGRITGEKPEGRLSGSLAAAVWCSINGVSIVRTHDPGETRKALDVVSAIRGI
jgi:dihydropteroate synthase